MPKRYFAAVVLFALLSGSCMGQAKPLTAANEADDYRAAVARPPHHTHKSHHGHAWRARREGGAAVAAPSPLNEPPPPPVPVSPTENQSPPPGPGEVDFGD